MKVYVVEYRSSDWTDIKSIVVVASSVVKAATEISKRKYIQYSGYVVSVQEDPPSVVIAK